jgi:glycosyltransferase involved in cell wall biosynthesis
VRYVGLLNELQKYYAMSIYAPGDTSGLKDMYSQAWICQSTPKPVGPVWNRKKFLKELALPSRCNPMKSFFPYSPGLDQLLAADQIAYDAVLYFGTFSYVFYGQREQNENIICDFCDSYLRQIDTQRRSNDHLLNKLSCFLDANYLSRVKKKFIPEKLKILAITDTDARYISSALDKNAIYSIPNGVNMRISDVNKSLKGKYSSKYVIFVGNLNYRVNVESILEVVYNIWPSISEQHPEMILKIIGRWPTAELEKAAAQAKGIELVGPVEDVTPYYVEAKLFLAPMFSGGGLKNKFLESFSAGTPIVTTPEGVRGLDFQSGCQGEIGRTTEELINCAGKILSCTEDIYATYVKKCITLASKYNWETIGLELKNIIDKNGK